MSSLIDMRSSIDEVEDTAGRRVDSAILLYVVMMHLAYFLFYLVVLWFYPPGWIVSGVILLVVATLVVMADRRSLFAVVALTLVVGLEAGMSFGQAFSSSDVDWNGLDNVVAVYAALATVATVGLVGLSGVALKERMVRSRPSTGPQP